MTTTSDDLRDPFDVDPCVDSTGVRWTRHRNPDQRRPYIKVPQGDGTLKEKLYTRVTTYIDCLDDKSALFGWSTRMTLTGLQLDADLRRRLMVADLDDRLELNAIGHAALEAAGAHDKARHGTNLHWLSEQAERGQMLRDSDGVLASAEDIADIAALMRHMDLWGIHRIETERRIVVDELNVTGTPDGITPWPDWLEPWTRKVMGLQRDSANVVWDLKTGRVDKYTHPKNCTQVATYALGEWYDGWTGERSPLPDVSQSIGLLTKLYPGEARCETFVVDLAKGREGIALAGQVREWRRTGVGAMTRIPDDIAPVLTA